MEISSGPVLLLLLLLFCLGNSVVCATSAGDGALLLVEKKTSIQNTTKQTETAQIACTIVSRTTRSTAVDRALIFIVLYSVASYGICLELFAFLFLSFSFCAVHSQQRMTQTIEAVSGSNHRPITANRNPTITTRTG